MRQDIYEEATRLGLRHTSNTLVKFQALLNGTVYDEKNISSLISILTRTPYPTMFYRIANLMHLLPQTISVEISSQVISLIDRKEFSCGVKIELRSRFS